MRFPLIVLAVLLLFSSEGICQTTKQDSLRILFTGGFRGSLESCSNCPSSNGGLARRTQVLKDQFARTNLLTLDAGQFLDLDPEMGTYYSRCGLITLHEQGLEVALVSSRDLFYGGKFLLDIADATGIKFISANLIDKTTQKSVFPLWITREVMGKKIGICGLSNYMPNRRVTGMGNWTEIPPQNALKQLQASIPSDTYLNILLTDLSEAELRELIPSFPEIDIVVTSSRQVNSGNAFILENASSQVLIVKPQPNGAAIDGVSVPLINQIKSDQIVHFSYPVTSNITEDPSTRTYINNCLGR